MNLFDIICKPAGQDECIAVIEGDKAISYRTLEEWSRQIGQALKEKIGTGHNIGLFCSRSVEYLVGYFGIMYSENCVVPLDEKLTVYELDSQITNCNVQLMITNLTVEECSLPMIKIELNNAENITYRWLSDIGEREPRFLKTDACILLPSSGTTSSPKRIMHSSENILRNAVMHSESLELNSTDIAYIMLPMGFGYCNTAQIVCHLWLGSTLVLQKGSLSATVFFRNVEKHCITTVTVVPSLLKAILDSTMYEKYDLTSLRYIIVGGSKLLPSIIEQFNSKFAFHVRLVQTYGQTEAGPRLTTCIYDRNQPITGRLVGSPLKGVEFKVVNQEGRELAANEVGHILVKTPSLMLGYYKNPLATEKAISNGFLISGDLGYLDEDGQLHLTGRLSNIIIRGGKNINPEEIEEILNIHEGIAESRVFGDEQEDAEEYIIAEIVLKDGVWMTSEDIINHCRKYLSSYKVPRKIKLVTHIAKTYNGKIVRNKGG